MREQKFSQQIMSAITFFAYKVEYWLEWKQEFVSFILEKESAAKNSAAVWKQLLPAAHEQKYKMYFCLTRHKLSQNSW